MPIPHGFLDRVELCKSEWYELPTKCADMTTQRQPENLNGLTGILEDAFFFSPVMNPIPLPGEGESQLNRNLK